MLCTRRCHKCTLSEAWLESSNSHSSQAPSTHTGTRTAHTTTPRVCQVSPMAHSRRHTCHECCEPPRAQAKGHSSARRRYLELRGPPAAIRERDTARRWCRSHSHQRACYGHTNMTVTTMPPAASPLSASAKGPSPSVQGSEQSRVRVRVPARARASPASLRAPYVCLRLFARVVLGDLPHEDAALGAD